MKGQVYIIGCGGVGSWLAPSLALLLDPKQLILVDGDKLEPKNLNRQLFTKADLGKFKAEALAKKYGTQFLNQYYSVGTISHRPSDWVIAVVDNHPARRAVLSECDRYGCQAILASNETHSSEALYYRPKWKGTALDPREIYSEIRTGSADDPLARSGGCTGEAQVANPQLVSANFQAAALAQHLLVLWGLEVPKLDEDILERLPFHLKANLSKLEQTTVRERTANNESKNTDSGVVSAPVIAA